MTQEPDRSRENDGTAGEPDSGARSADACPACGAHRLAMIDFPKLPGTAYLPASDALGIPVGPSQGGAPGIGCLACGASWPSLSAFRAAQGGEDAPEPER